MSDLLNSASLVMIPSGYKEDVVYSQIPTSGAGDLSFTRASNGTRINSQGLVEVCPWNLLQQSEALNTTWSDFGTGTTVTANATTAPNGTGTADLLEFPASVGSAQYVLGQIVNLTAGVPYTFSFWAKAVSGTITNLVVRINGTEVVLGETITTEWQRFTKTLTPTTASDDTGFKNRSAVSGSGTAINVYIWGAQLNIGSTAKPYFPTIDRLNVPRLTYQNGGGGCPSLLLEKQSTNLVVQSNDMTTWTNGAGTMTKNATTSPDGTNNALSFDNTADCSTFVAASNGVHSWSLYVKQGTSPTASIDMSDGATGDVITTFTFATKTFSGTSAGGSWTSPSTSYIECGNGWFRITLIATKNAGSSIGHKIIASGSGYTYVYGAQLEASSYPTSYIPTTSSSATRVADACLTASVPSLIGQSEGTMFVEMKRTNLAETFFIILSANAGTTANSYLNSIYFFQLPNNLFASDGFVSGAQQLKIELAEGLPIGNNKIALAYKSNDFVLYINGTQIGTDTSGSVAAMNYLTIGGAADVANTTNIINQCALFKTRLTNAELASLTTL